jgi:hypothetical protein
MVFFVGVRIYRKLSESGFTGFEDFQDGIFCGSWDLQDLRIYRMVFFVGVGIYRKLSESGFSGFEDFQDGIFCGSWDLQEII